MVPITHFLLRNWEELRLALLGSWAVKKTLRESNSIYWLRCRLSNSTEQPSQIAEVLVDPERAIWAMVLWSSVETSNPVMGAGNSSVDTKTIFGTFGARTVGHENSISEHLSSSKFLSSKLTIINSEFLDRKNNNFSKLNPTIQALRYFCFYRLLLFFVCPQFFKSHPCQVEG
jgi:hypothetical protein